MHKAPKVVIDGYWLNLGTGGGYYLGHKSAILRVYIPQGVATQSSRRKS